ncbi:MAG: 30S ribosomal protein S6e [Thaumarchaeota archaeon]|nr:30S ribosomal protein S6e [Nitrososphaerota archaeon]
MVNFKLVLSDRNTTKSEVVELKDSSAQILLGRKIGETIDGALIGLAGKVTITGGSDRAGFPMRADVSGGGKKHILLTRGVGLTSKTEGLKKRKLVRGNTISEEVYQVNAVRSERGTAPPKASGKN